jgi:hypothetical protein
MRYVSRVPLAPVEQPPSVSLSCNAITPEVEAGQSVQIVAEPIFTGARNELIYRWTSTGGSVEGVGQMIAIDTSNLDPGTYQVEGNAGFNSNPKIESTCKAAFRVKAVGAMARSTPPTEPELPAID